MKHLFFFTLFLFVFASANAQIITTVAGIGIQDFSGDDGPATSAGLFAPYDVAVDAAGNLYIADGYNNRIRKVSASGIITTIAGTGTMGYNGDDKPATDADLYRPMGITCDHSGNIFFAELYNHRIRKISAATGIITTVAGTGTQGYNGDDIPASTAQLNTPHHVEVNAAGELFITDLGNYRIRKISNAGIITTIAGTGTSGYNGNNGPATAAELKDPYSLALDNGGNLYISEYHGNVIRKITAAGIISTIAGTGTYGYSGDNGPATVAEFKSVSGVAVDSGGNIYIGDVLNHRIRKISATGIITTIAGTGLSGYSGDNGIAINAQLTTPCGVAIGANGNVYIADFGNNRIRRINNPLSVLSIDGEKYGFKAYPNPSSGIFTVSGSGWTQIIMRNSVGQIIKELSVDAGQPKIIQVDVPPGIYFLNAITPFGMFTERIVITK